MIMTIRFLGRKIAYCFAFPFYFVKGFMAGFIEGFEKAFGSVSEYLGALKTVLGVVLARIIPTWIRTRDPWVYLSMAQFIFLIFLKRILASPLIEFVHKLISLLLLAGLSQSFNLSRYTRQILVVGVLLMLAVFIAPEYGALHLMGVLQAGVSVLLMGAFGKQEEHKDPLLATVSLVAKSTQFFYLFSVATLLLMGVGVANVASITRWVANTLEGYVAMLSGAVYLMHALEPPSKREVAKIGFSMMKGPVSSQRSFESGYAK